MSTLNYIDENGNINKAGVIPKNYPSTNVSYNNSQGGLSADNVQEAIDEIADGFTPVNITTDYSVSGIITVFKVGKLVEVSIEKNISAVSHGTEIISKMPKPFGTVKYLTVGMSNGQSLPCIIEGVSGQNYGHLIAYYPPGSQTAARIDATITYFADV